MKVVFCAEQLAHQPVSYLSSGALADHPEQPERAQQLLDAFNGVAFIIQEASDALQ